MLALRSVKGRSLEHGAWHRGLILIIPPLGCLSAALPVRSVGSPFLFPQRLAASGLSCLYIEHLQLSRCSTLHHAADVFSWVADSSCSFSNPFPHPRLLASGLCLAWAGSGPARARIFPARSRLRSGPVPGTCPAPVRGKTNIFHFSDFLFFELFFSVQGLGSRV